MLFSLFTGSRIDLAFIRALKATLGRRSPLALNSKVPPNRVAHTSCDLVRSEVPLERFEFALGLESHALKNANSYFSNRDSGSKAAQDDGGEERKRRRCTKKKLRERAKPA